MRWIPFPFVRIILFLLAGILSGIYQPDLISYNLALWSGAFFLLLFLSLAIFFPASSELIRGGIALVTVFALGYIRAVNHNQSKEPNHIIQLHNELEAFTVQLSNQPAQGEKTSKAEGEIEAAQVNGKWRKAEGKIQLLFLQRDNTFQYGDVLLVKGNPQAVRSPTNPGEFDYRKFLAFKNIYHQKLVNVADVRFIKHKSGSLLFEWAYAARAWGDNVLRKNLKGEQEHAIASALILGITDELDWNMLNAYASTGVLHVLSVSGLHVGIVYMILLFLFKPLENKKAGKWILAIVSIMVLWAYAFITGLSPSVLRSVTMFTIIALSRPIDRHTNIYNTLSISAGILLIYDPFMIMSVGFQLSYLALLGIVYFQPRMYQLWEPRWIWLDKIWEVSSVSIAAQLVTFPVSLLYFHQFPIYFLFANLLVIPASSIVLIGGLILLAIQFIDPLAHGIGLLLEFIIKGMNSFIGTVNNLPWSTVNNIAITSLQYWLLMGVLVFAALMFRFRRFHYAVICSLFIVVFAVIQWTQYFDFFTKQKITIYNIPHHTAIDLFDKGKAYFLFDSVLNNDARKIAYSITPNRVTYGINYLTDAIPHTKTIAGARVIRWRDKYFLQITNSAFKVPLNLPSVDYCIISNNAVHDLIIIQKQLKFKTLIIDSSNSYHVADDLLKRGRSNKLDVYSVLHEGAYEELI
ncbi:MAG TPA: ComEC/Rec2 family competence protein [Cyclobacteriaceae bacterium]